MAGRLKDRLSLPVLAFAVFVVVVFSTTAFGLVAGDPFGLITGDPSGSTASPAPTIQSDKADYSPGETATLTGSNWQPGETVHINVDDDEGQTWSRDVDVTADQSGNITYQFRLPDWFVALYTVRATGSSGAVATTTIIDANLKVSGSFAGSTTDGYTLTYTRFQDAGCGGAARNDDPQTQNYISAGTFTVPPAGQNSATLTAAAISAQGREFLRWTDSDGNEVPGVALNGRTICADFPPGGTDTAGTDKTYTAHYGAKANHDLYSTPEDNTLNVPVPGVLGDDGGPNLSVKDSNSSASGVQPESQPNNGTLTINANGSFAYTPNGNFNGTDSFTYKAPNGSANSNIATVSITVNAVNDAPVAAIQPPVSTNEDTAKVITLSASDVDGNDLTFAIVANSGPNHGTLGPIGPVTCQGTVCSANVTYKPNANYNGPDSFLFKANDGTADSAPAPVSIIVTPDDDAPTADAQSLTTDEDVAKEITLTGNDVDGDSLTYGVVDGPQHGQLSGSGATRTYTPDPNYHGPDSFTYKANDGTTDSNSAKVDITVNPVSDAPEANDDQSVTTDGDNAEDVTPGASDVEGDNLTHDVVAAPEHGSLSGSGITVNPVNDAPVAKDDEAMTDEDAALSMDVLSNDEDVDADSLSVSSFDATSAEGGAVSLDNGKLKYEPAPDFNGTDSFTYEAEDASLDSNSAKVSITVNAVNDAPVAKDDSATTDEDTELTIDAPGVLDNDEDVDGDSLGAATVARPAHGTLTLNAEGSFEYMPDANYSGSDSFDYKVCDNGSPEPKCSVGSAKVNIAINPVNDAPVAVDDANNTTDEDTPLTVAAPGVLGNDTDVENVGLTAVKVSDPAHGQLMLNNDGSFTYTPEDDYYGPDSFTYKANDGGLDSSAATVTIDVKAVNDEPVAEDDAATTPEGTPVTIPAAYLLANDAAGPPNESGQMPTITEVSNFQHGQAVPNANGSVTFTPNANYNGPDASFDYRVCDDGSPEPKCSVETAKMNVTVNAVNDAPVAVADSFSTDEDETLPVAAPSVLSNDTDVENDSLTAAQASGPAHGHLTLNADGSFSYTPDPNYHGPDSFTYKASDGNPDSEAAATVSITVNSVNDAPVADDQSVTTDEDTPKAITLGGIDGDGDSLTYSVVVGPQHGQLSGSGTDLTYTPDNDYHGPDSFTFKANDGTADSNVATVSITVKAVNDAPVVTNLQGADAANEGETKAYTSFSFASGSPNCGASDKGVVDGTPVINNDGSGSFECRFLDGGMPPTQVGVSAQVTDDGQATSAPASKDVAVSNVAPKIESLSGPAQVLTNQLVTFTGTHSDPAGLLDNPFTWQWSGGTSTDIDKNNSFVTKFAACGPQNVSATVTDKDGGTSAAATLSNPVQAYNGNFLPPLQVGKDNLVQKGQVVPVKISVAGCDGLNLAGLNPEIGLAKGDPTAGIDEPDYIVPATVSASDTSGFMRPVSDGYIYNLRIPSDTTVKANDLYTIWVSPFGIASGQHMVIGVQIRE